jgi:GMP synthase-like glutamine amidotransferase
MPSCLVVQHVVPEPAFAIEKALLDAGVTLDIRQVYAGDTIPVDTSGLDGLVVMGGPMSAASDDGFPTRAAETSLLTAALRVGVPTLGVCLGAQLLAAAAGASVYPGASGPEVGWAPVRLAPPCRDDTLFAGLPEPLTVLHWHTDTFDLPAGAQRLISSEMYANQAFRIADAAWGVQFHLEVTADAVGDFLREFAADIADIPGRADAIRTATAAAVEELSFARDLVCARFAGLVAGAHVAGVSPLFPARKL